MRKHTQPNPQDQPKQTPEHPAKPAEQHPPKGEPVTPLGTPDYPGKQ